MPPRPRGGSKDRERRLPKGVTDTEEHAASTSWWTAVESHQQNHPSLDQIVLRRKGDTSPARCPPPPEQSLLNRDEIAGPRRGVVDELACEQYAELYQQKTEVARARAEQGLPTYPSSTDAALEAALERVPNHRRPVYERAISGEGPLTLEEVRALFETGDDDELQSTNANGRNAFGVLILS